MDKEFKDKVLQLVRETGAFIRAELGNVRGKDIETKSLNSLVSYVDKQAEVMLVEGLSVLTPNCGFVTEEDTPDDDEKNEVWIIDPLDGTTNFLRQIPHFSISVALKIKEEVVLGVVYHVMQDEMYYAVRGKGAYMNDIKINVSSIKSFNECIVATGFPYEHRDTLPFVPVLQEVMTKGRGIRRMGSAALDLSYVAIGRYDAYYECCLNRWDIAAGVLIVIESGGQVTDFHGGQTYEDGKQIIASNRHIHKELQGIIAEHV